MGEALAETEIGEALTETDIGEALTETDIGEAPPAPLPSPTCPSPVSMNERIPILCLDSGHIGPFMPPKFPTPAPPARPPSALCVAGGDGVVRGRAVADRHPDGVGGGELSL